MKGFYNIFVRELGLLAKNPVYLWCLVLLPILVVVFFTTLMEEGQPQEMPVGIVDNDNTSTTRALTKKLDEMQTAHIVAHYPTVAAARHAMQQDSIYAFLYFPEGTTDKLISMRQPKISFYYSNTSLTAGALLFKDLKTVSTLGSAAVGQATLRAKGFTDGQITAFLMPVNLDVHNVNNPWINYNFYLSTMTIPGCLMIFIMVLTAYTLGMELKKGTAKELLQMADGNIFKALTAKLLPLTLMFFLTMFGQLLYVFYVLGFPHPGGLPMILMLAVLAVLSGQGFGVLMFGLIPSMRMSMSMCSLWGVLGFSMVGTGFPVFAMDKILEALSWTFPLRHYFIIYAENIFNGLPLEYTFWHFAVLVLLASSPLLVINRIKTIYSKYTYLE